MPRDRQENADHSYMRKNLGGNIIKPPADIILSLIFTFMIFLSAPLTAYAAPAAFSNAQVIWDGDAVLTGGVPGHIYVQSAPTGGYELVLKDIELNVINNAILLVGNGTEYKIKLSGEVIINSAGNNGIYTDNNADNFAEISIDSNRDVVISGANTAIWVGLHNNATRNTADLSISATAGNIRINPGTVGGDGILATGSVSMNAGRNIEIYSRNTGVYADTGDIDITANTIAVESDISSGISAPYGEININARGDVVIAANNNGVHGDQAVTIVSGGIVDIETKTSGTPAVISLNDSVKVKAVGDIYIAAAGTAVSAEEEVSINSGRNITIETIKDNDKYGYYGIVANSTVSPSVTINVGRIGLIRGGLLAIKAHSRLLTDGTDDPVDVTDHLTKKIEMDDVLWSGDNKVEVSLSELNERIPVDPYILITPPQVEVSFQAGANGGMYPIDPGILLVYVGDSLTAGQIPLITPDGSYTFTGWKSSADDNVYTDLTKVKILKNVTFTALYSLITINYDHAATVNVKLNGSPWENRNISLTADAAVFIQLYERSAGVYRSNVSPGVYAIYADGVNTGKTIEIMDGGANEAALYFYTLTLFRGEGVNSVSRSGAYQAGTQVNVSASPRGGYAWSKWIAAPDVFGDVAAKDASILMPDYPLTLTATAKATSGEYPSQVHTVTVIVKHENGDLIENVTVSLGQRSGTTGREGTVVLGNIPFGIYTLELVKLPDISFTGSLEVDRDITVVITIGEPSLGGNLYSRFSRDNEVWVDNDDLHSVYRNSRNTLNNDDTLGVTRRDYEYYEAGGDITIYLVAAETGVLQQPERDEIRVEIKADGWNRSFDLDISAYKSAVDKDGVSIYNKIQLKELNSLVKVHVFLKEEHRGHGSYGVYRHHDGVVERLPQKPGGNQDNECFEISPDGTELILYLKKFSVYAVAYNVPGDDFPPDEVSIIDIIVNNRPIGRVGDDFSVFAVCGEDKAVINVGTFDPNTTVIINGVEQNPRTVYLPDYGDNYITITVRALNGNEKKYTLTVNRRVPWDQIVTMRWNNTLSIINNPENNGGFSFVTYRWFREGQEFNTAQWWSAGAQGQLLDTINWYEAEGTTADGNRLRTCPHQIVLEDFGIK